PLHSHHVLGASAPRAHPDTEVDPQLLKNPLVANFLNGSLPAGMIEVNGRYQAAPENVPRPPVVILTPEEAVDRVLGKVKDGFIKDPDGLTEAMAELIALYQLRDGIVPSLVRTNLPFNSPQVRAGGYAMLKV